MSKNLRRGLAVLTAVAFTSFVTVRAQDAGESSATFRDNPAWQAANGVLSSSASGLENALVSRVTLADSITSFEFRAAPDARATLYLLGRYGVSLAGNGDWQPVMIRLRAPRFDSGFNKQSN